MMEEKISKKQLRDFGLLIGFGFPIFFGWILPAITGHVFREWTLFVGIPVLILGLIAPLKLYFPYKAWMALGHALGWINMHLILGLVFIIVLQPIAYTMRIFGHDPLKKRFNNAKSYRENKKSHTINLTRIF